MESRDKIDTPQNDIQIVLGLWFILTVIGLTILSVSLPADTPRWISVIDALGVITGSITSVFVIVSASYAYWKREEILSSFKNRMGRLEFHNTGHPFAEKVDAVIIPVSNSGTDQPQWIINHLKPRFVALVCSKESCDNGRKLLDEYSKHCTFLNTLEELDEVRGRILEDPKNPEQAKHLAKAFIVEFLRRNVARGKIFVDTTGGMVPMSIGLFQGAEEEGVSSIYVNGSNKGRIVDPGKESDGDPIFMSDRTPDAHTT